MKMKHKLLYFPILLLLSCVKPDTGEVPGVTPDPPQEERPELLISGFSLPQCPDALIDMDHEAGRIDVAAPDGTDLSSQTITFTIPEGASSDPESGAAVDFSQPVRIFLSEESGRARKYTVSARLLLSSENSLLSLTCPKYYLKAEISGTDVTMVFPYGVNLSAVTLEAVISEGAASGIDFSMPVDLSSPRELVITAKDGTSTQTYRLTASHGPQDVAVRGVYLPSPDHTDSFITYDNIVSSINLLDRLNFNCIFVCGWARTQTAWNSKVLMANTTYANEAAGNMYAKYTGGTSDALADLITVAHSKGIKVILWMEYGFMLVSGDFNTENPLFKKHPDWMGMDNDGGYSAQGGGNYYLNAYNPEVREFILNLMEEAQEMYPEIDGFQGDDRLPALPRNSGYDEFTKALYKEQTGNEVPRNPENNKDWNKWRLDILNGFAVDMSLRLKENDEDCIVCFAPNRYPWCLEHLMQDWPTWIRSGVVDLLTVQCYFPWGYEGDLDNALKYMYECTDRMIMNPAMILKSGENVLSEEDLIEELRYNRQKGTCGESQFWFDGLHKPHVQKVFETFYPGKAIFPEL